MPKLILQIIAGILGIWLAVKFVAGVKFVGSLQILLLIGTILGVLNFFVRPPLKKITLPLRIITFGLFGLIINMAMLWIVDVLFLELDIKGILPLFWATIIVGWIFWALSIFFPVKKARREESSFKKIL